MSFKCRGIVAEWSQNYLRLHRHILSSHILDFLRARADTSEMLHRFFFTDFTVSIVQKSDALWTRSVHFHRTSDILSLHGLALQNMELSGHWIVKIAKCICLKLQHVFVSNLKIYLSHIIKCICLKLQIVFFSIYRMYSSQIA